MIVMSVYSIVDGLFVSNFVGTTAFAALNLIWPALAVVGALGLMVGTGGSALVSMTMGQNDYPRASHIFSVLIRFTLIMALVLAVPLLFLMKPIAIALGAEGAMVHEAVVYGSICALGLPGYMLQMAFQAFFMTAERPQMGTQLSILCGVTNMGLDALFILVFGWGLAGAAAASMIACAVGGFFPLWWFSSRRNDSRLRLNLLTRMADVRNVIRRACTNGLSEYVGNIAFNVVGICYNLQLMHYLGEDGVAAYGILMYIGFIFGAVFFGYNFTVGPVVGFNYGAQNTSELRSLLRHSAVLTLVAGALMAVVCEAGAEGLARVFVSYDESLLALTTRAIRLYMISLVLCGFNIFVSAWFTALNNGVISAVASFTRTLVFELAAVFILPLLLGIDGIWLAVNVAEFLAFLLTTSLLIHFRKRYHY
jgi:Na+-driven multidrug efflux pump